MQASLRSLARDLIALMLLVLALPVLAQNYDFVADSVNCIELNGDDWSTLRKALKNAKSWNDGKFQVVQIGDSHIQPDIMTAQVPSIWPRPMSRATMCSSHRQQWMTIQG